MTLQEKEWFIEAPWGRICIVAFGDCTDPPVLVCHGTSDCVASFRPLISRLPQKFYYIVVAFGDCTDPPVLVCHGTSDCVASFRPLISRLPQKFYYIGLELPGCGKSDPMPPGLMITAFDLIYSLHVVVNHFRWSQFSFIGHSLGSSLGIFYNLSYPDKINKMILLDPWILAYSVSAENFPKWYKISFTNYFEGYNKYGAMGDNPSYTQEEAINKIIERRGLDSEMAQKILERCTKKVDNGYVRFTFDPRYKILTYPPLTEEVQRKMFTSLKTAILLIITDTTSKQLFDPSSYLFDETSFPNNNYKVRVVEGTHDVHAIHPDRVAPLVAQLLLHELTGLEGRSKL